MRPLEGVLVLDFSTLVPGPLATLLLAEAGAEVIKVERPGRGDEMRSYEPRLEDESVNFLLLNRGKKSIAVDLKSQAGREKLRPLLERADVLVEQFRPGVMDRLGFGYEAVATINPRIVYCSITGYGQSGPLRDAAGHDLNYIAKTGLLALSMGTPETPVVPPALIADIAGGAYPAVMNILLALRERYITGTGRRLDVAMTDNLFTFMYWAQGAGLATGTWPGNGADLVTGGTPRYRLYPTADGRMVAAAPIEQRFWDTFCDIIGLDPRWRDDGRDPAGTTAEVARVIGSRDAAAWEAVFEGKDCCCCVVRGLEEAFGDPHFGSRGLFSHDVKHAGASIGALPVPIDRGFRGPPRALETPELGQHNADFA
jgi:alpha-methylacyl-CoA racemase